MYGAYLSIVLQSTMQLKKSPSSTATLKSLDKFLSERVNCCRCVICTRFVSDLFCFVFYHQSLVKYHYLFVQIMFHGISSYGVSA